MRSDVTVNRIPRGTLRVQHYSPHGDISMWHPRSSPSHTSRRASLCWSDYTTPTSPLSLYPHTHTRPCPQLIPAYHTLPSRSKRSFTRFSSSSYRIRSHLPFPIATPNNDSSCQSHFPTVPSFRPLLPLLSLPPSLVSSTSPTSPPSK